MYEEPGVGLFPFMLLPDLRHSCALERPINGRQVVLGGVRRRATFDLHAVRN